MVRESLKTREEKGWKKQGEKMKKKIKNEKRKKRKKEMKNKDIIKKCIVYTPESITW